MLLPSGGLGPNPNNPSVAALWAAPVAASAPQPLPSAHVWACCATRAHDCGSAVFCSADSGKYCISEGGQDTTAKLVCGQARQFNVAASIITCVEEGQ